jgi:hypothetical protein
LDSFFSSFLPTICVIRGREDGGAQNFILLHHNH